MCKRLKQKVAFSEKGFVLHWCHKNGSHSILKCKEYNLKNIFCDFASLSEVFRAEKLALNEVLFKAKTTPDQISKDGWYCFESIKSVSGSHLNPFT